MYSQYQIQIQHIKQSEKKIQEKQETILKEEFKTNTIEMEKTIENLKQDILKLNEALEETKVENNNNKLKKNTSNISKNKEKSQTESELKNKYAKYQKELNLAEQKYRSMQAKFDKHIEMQVDLLETPLTLNSQSLKKTKLQNNKEDLFNELQKSSSQHTPTKMSNVIATQDTIAETENSLGENKFFKLRNTQVRRYGNQKNKFIRT
ncbi:uncharacterized protein LOC122516951 [Polistes fuscatus]|uniref:uncharacterized protein LOC122516951 n=1 Tax=Polistes fuscatus TaxID=30207 RepID=UPI001CA7D38A|nr:uncharacterized protein LOC122516951 [Polistes fuscatus]